MKRNQPIDYNNIIEILQSSGRSRSVEDFPVLQIYMQETGLYPFIKNYMDSPMSHQDFMEEIKVFNPEHVFCKEEIDCKSGSNKITYSLFKIAPGYYVELSSSLQILEEYDEIMHDHLKSVSKSETFAFITYIILLCPPPTSSLYCTKIEDSVLNIVKTQRLKRNTTSPSMGIICQEDGEFYIKDFYLKHEYNLVQGDLHYGKGFMNFHSELLKRFKDDRKGLVLLHGNPGTGKTWYIRCLMKELISINKFIIYLPPTMMDYMISPEMITYISQVVMEKNEQGKSCIILLEDAESLISSRKSGNRNDGITNLLNMTDGLLNDMLNVQVIATFNVQLSSIDEALLRPERLIARKEFKELSISDSNVLLSYLKLNKKTDKECTLAEIYSQQKQNEILIHEYNPTTGKIGFRSQDI